MPIIKSAIKKLRRDNKRRLENRIVRLNVKKSIKMAKTASSANAVSKAFSLIDKAVKKGLIKKNTAARKKSQLAKALAKAVATPAIKRVIKAKKASKSTKTAKTSKKKA